MFFPSQGGHLIANTSILSYRLAPLKRVHICFTAQVISQAALQTNVYAIHFGRGDLHMI